MRRPVHVTVFGTSLDPNSRSQLLAREAIRQLEDRGVERRLIDLRDIDCPESGRAGAAEHPVTRELREEVDRATHLVFAAAIYNYQVSSAAKNLLELIGGRGLVGKTVALMCSAGGRSSYMALMPFANSLMLDFRCWVVPRFVYATGSDFEDDGVSNAEIAERIARMLDDLLSR